MLTYFSTKLRNPLYIALLATILFSLLGMPNLPSTGAQEAWTPTQTGDVSGQIVGGAPASLGEWPWQVVVFPGPFLCGGSLVSPQWVVTAAHCVEGMTPPNVDVIAGVYNLASPTPGYQLRGVIQIISHPSYNPTTLDSDIALLKLDAAITLGGSGETKTGLISLASNSMGTLEGRNSWVTGWGALSTGGPGSNQLYEVQVPIITNTICNDPNHLGGQITANMLCAGILNTGGKGFCQGDSGGPVVVQNGAQWKLAGVVSFTGSICGSPQTLSVSTRVSNYTTWINSNVPDMQSVFVSDTLKANYTILPNQSQRVSYAGVDSGPVKIQGSGNGPIVASMRVAYNNGSDWTSYSELMGLPVNQLSSSYTFPWYNNADLNTQLRFGNVGTVSSQVKVFIGGDLQSTHTLIPNQSKRISYDGLDDGPVVIQSSGNVPIIASMRVAYSDGSAVTSFSEMMGLPSNKLTNSYTFPWYNNADLDSQLRFGNVGTVSTQVKVFIGGDLQSTHTLLPNQSRRISYDGLDDGPVVIQSSGNVPIIASMRVLYNNGTAVTSFSEMMGLPTNALSSRYAFPVYDNVQHDSQLRFGNVGTVNTQVKVVIGGVLKSTHNLAPNQSRRISYDG